MNLTNLDTLVHDFNAARQREDLDSMRVACAALIDEIDAAKWRERKDYLAVAVDAARDLADRFNPQCLKGQRVCKQTNARNVPDDLCSDEECPRCEGNGEYWINNGDSRTPAHELITCRTCGGTGRLHKRTTEQEHNRTPKGRWT